MDENKIATDEQQAPPAAPPVVPDVNKIAELERKLAERETEVNQLREAQLRQMGQASQQQFVQPQPDNSGKDEDEEIAALFQMGEYKKATEKMIAKKEKEVVAMTQVVAAQTYQREVIKQQAVQRFPQLRDPNSEFFKRVAFHMDSHPEKYRQMDGILDACSRVAYEMNLTPPNPNAGRANEMIRQQVSNASSSVEGNRSPAPSEDYELDSKGLEMARKLGIDPKSYKARLSNFVDGKNEYQSKEGKTGKASL